MINDRVRLNGRIGGAQPGRKVLTLVHALVAGGSHIDHAHMLCAGATQAVLGHQVMAPSTIGTFLRSFTFGHIRQLGYQPLPATRADTGEVLHVRTRKGSANTSRGCGSCCAGPSTTGCTTRRDPSSPRS